MTNIRYGPHVLNMFLLQIFEQTDMDWTFKIKTATAERFLRNHPCSVHCTAVHVEDAWKNIYHWERNMNT